jgi:hypothetical protein
MQSFWQHDTQPVVPAATHVASTVDDSVHPPDELPLLDPLLEPLLDPLLDPELEPEEPPELEELDDPPEPEPDEPPELDELEPEPDPEPDPPLHACVAAVRQVASPHDVHGKTCAPTL